MRKNELVERGHAPLPFAQCRKQEQRGMAPLYPSPSPLSPPGMALGAARLCGGHGAAGTVIHGSAETGKRIAHHLEH
ncbi:hypothetical protein, partial [Stenotrophomonas tumulicola]|uniref:hypothetical protein n=1 Tax=Stenotrophomonas tumulicola TaxID=1685415 RepID=UPI001C70F84F